jgi:hypothetical protein
VLPTVALAVVVAFAPGRIELALRIYALVVAATALAVSLAWLRRSYPRPRRRPGPPPSQPPARPAVLARIEDEVALGVAGAFDLHHRLRPRLRRIASELLAARRALDLDAEPVRARDALGEPAWELMRADRQVPDDRQARGIAIPELRIVVESLEKL